MPGEGGGDWKDFQERVAHLFRKLPGCRVSVGEVLHGARIGAVEVDVVARFGDQRTEKFGSRPHGFVFTVIVECKFWNRRIPQEKLFALKTVVDDIGAAMGILVSELGVQSGAKRYLGSPVNVLAVTFTELEGLIAGMHVTVCSLCGNQILVPFGPIAGKRTCCKACYRRFKSGLDADS